MITLQLAILLFFLAVAVVNTVSVRNIDDEPDAGRAVSSRPVSVLVPARNEERDIDDCILSLLAQEYRFLDIAVLDDQSTDSTGARLAALRDRSSRRVVIIDGAEPPPGWLGKPHACAQLARSAQGDVLLFVDADVRCDPRAVSCTVAALERTGADLVSVFPHQQFGSVSERLVVPIMDFFLYVFLPFPILRRSKSRRTVAANGQWIAIRREMYDRCGGHEGVRSMVLEDIALAEAVKRMGGRVEVLCGIDSVRCRMYRGLGEVIRGFGKNMFAASGYRVIPFSLFLFFFVWIFASPYLLAPFLSAYRPALAILVCLNTVVAVRYSHPLFESVVLRPFGILAAAGIGLYSMAKHYRGTSTWKGRTIP